MTTTATPSSRVLLTLSCQGLKDLGLLSKSDPMVYVMYRECEDKEWQHYGRTEALQDTLNPQFTTQLEITYLFEIRQHIRFLVVDVDKLDNVDEHKEIGEAETCLATIIAGREKTFPLTLEGENRGLLTCKAQEVIHSKQEVELEFRCIKVDNKDLIFFGVSDPYLELFRVSDNVKVHRTEYVNNNSSPEFSPFKIGLRKLCDSKLENDVRIVCWDWNDSGIPDFIGECTVTANDLVNKTQTSWELKNKKNKKSGELVLVNATVKDKHRFIDYIQSGLEVSLIASIDFTASNEPPSEPESLHYRSETNQYVLALRAVGNILAPFDSDGLFPVYGFGAKINGQENHGFRITQKEGTRGVEGMVQSYLSVLQQVTLWGPTNFAPSIHIAAQSAAEAKANNQNMYFVLLMITDGIISDLELTISEIVEASSLPLSIVIIGVGDTDFDEMKELDGDQQKLRSKKKEAARDIVQFVRFSEYRDNTLLLTQQVMQEIPGQLEEYFELQKTPPNPK